MTDETPSRRRVLMGGLGLAATGLAGCTNFGPAGSGRGASSVFEETAVSGSVLEVTLTDDTEVSKVNLIDPSGSEFGSKSVTTGATAIEFELFDLSRGSHYQPGEYSLVAVSDEDELASTTIPLRPDLEIVDVEQYTGGRSTPSNRANLLVTVENSGTGPTWVYYVGYENALDRDANLIPSNEYAKTVPLLNLDLPESENEVILEPSDSAQLLGSDPPFLLTTDDNCNDLTVEASVIVSSGVGTNPRKRFKATLSGDVLKANFEGTCSDISIELKGEEGATDG